MDKRQAKENASKFVGTDMAYIQTEIKRGQTPETILSGDYLTIIYGIVAELNRMSELMGTTFGDVMTICGMVKEIGYKEVRKFMEDNTDADFTLRQGEDWQEEWKAEQQVVLDRQLRNKDIEIDRLKKEIKRLEISVQIHKGNTENARKELKEKEQAFAKELKEKEVRIRALMNFQKLGEDDLK